MQEEIYSAMYRMICKYGWGWGMTCDIINRQYGTMVTQSFVPRSLSHCIRVGCQCCIPATTNPYIDK